MKRWCYLLPLLRWKTSGKLWMCVCRTCLSSAVAPLPISKATLTGANAGCNFRTWNYKWSKTSLLMVNCGSFFGGVGGAWRGCSWAERVSDRVLELGTEMERLRFSLARTDQTQSESIRGTAPVGWFADKAREARLRWFWTSPQEGQPWGWKNEWGGPDKEPKRRFMDMSGSSPVCAEACACCCPSGAVEGSLTETPSFHSPDSQLQSQHEEVSCDHLCPETNWWLMIFKTFHDLYDCMYPADQ